MLHTSTTSCQCSWELLCKQIKDVWPARRPSVCIHLLRTTLEHFLLECQSRPKVLHGPPNTNTNFQRRHDKGHLHCSSCTAFVNSSFFLSFPLHTTAYPQPLMLNSLRNRIWGFWRVLEVFGGSYFWLSVTKSFHTSASKVIGREAACFCHCGTVMFTLPHLSTANTSAWLHTSSRLFHAILLSLPFIALLC